jgi:membrane-bound serine protease (ClpP class)
MINSKSMKTYQILLSLTITLLVFLGNAHARSYEINKSLEISIDSPIGPATYNYALEAFEKARVSKSDLVIIKLNTPGGLLSSTKNILTLIGNSSIPVAVWITPEGSSATSAGAIIASAAHILVMSDGTNIGAATPIQMSGDLEKGDLRNKAVNDLVALVKSLAQTRKRNTKLYADMIEKASSFEAKTALKENLIDGIANSRAELFKIINNREILVKGEQLSLKVNSNEVKEFAMDLGQKLLNILANPNTAYILFLIGAALFYLEFQTPGGFIAGGAGAVFLIFAAIGFQVLPLNFGALALIVLSFMLFILEIYITSYGILSLAGIASLVSGSLFLYRTDDAYISISKELIFSATGAVALFIGFIFFVILKDHKNIGKKKFNAIIGQPATVISEIEEHDGYTLYQVKVHGEIWKLKSNQKLEIGSDISIAGQDGLTLEA